MDIYKKRLLEFAERTLKQTKNYQNNREMGMSEDENYKVSYLLCKGSVKAPESVLAYAVNEESVLLFHPLDEPIFENVLNDMLFYFDYDLFQYLEGGYDLTFMTSDAHSGVWYEISQGHGTSEIACVGGMQKYLHYCKTHNITKERLARDVGYDGMNVMTLYDRSAVKEKRSLGLER
jgi:hypothetical protein